MANNYWANRLTKSQALLFNRTRSQIDRRLRRYYKSLALQVIEDYEAVYNKLLATTLDGKQPTPADLYKLDKYWELQGNLRQRLRKLGEREISLLTKQFELTYFDTYYALEIDGLSAYKTLDDSAIGQVINQIWCTDGKNWSQRIWQNTQLLQETLEEGLIHTVAAGKKPSFLKQALQERFNVSYNNADMIVRTELAHIQTQAAKQRYQDYGIQQLEVLADPDERTCEICGKLDGKRYSINDVMPVPAHPRCRCCMVPVID